MDRPSPPAPGDTPTAPPPPPPFMSAPPPSRELPRSSTPSVHPDIDSPATPKMQTEENPALSPAVMSALDRRLPQSPTPAPAPAAPTEQSAGNIRPLNVTDALGYLDAVKSQFQEQPDVYNRFLDIMKDFKSQSIDTPGVIERVSRLFQGNALLIQGFNTFLPPGYRIECSQDPNEPNLITVTTPMGVMTQIGNSSFSLLPRQVPPVVPIGPPPELPSLGPLPPPSSVLLGSRHPTPGPSSFPNGPGSGLAHPLPPIGSGPASRPITPLPIPPHMAQLQLQHGAVPPGGSGPFSPGLPGGTTAAANFLGGLSTAGASAGTGGGQAQDKASGGEFNHAIVYLNKIKTRFVDDPNTYKQFLEILQTYQKEQKHLQDSQVYAQVQMLFKDAPDLLEEFKNFLPTESGGSLGGPGLIGILPHPPGGSIVAQPVWVGPDPPIASTSGDKSGRAPAKRKKRPAEKDLTPVPPPSKGVGRSKKAKREHRADSPTYSPYQAEIGVPHAQPLQQTHSGHMLMHPGGGHSMGTPDEVLFFDRVRKALDTREVYEEFLKLLHIFSKDIIDVRTLVERAELFLGDGDLFVEFKKLMAYEDPRFEMGPPGSIRTGPPEQLSAPPVDDDLGPSYRRLPASEVPLACSGRDETARSVLNDEWVSHPTWASEETGFATHKKNQFEDAIHKCEEERHEYSVHLLGMQRTIAVLEPLAARVEDMNADERAAFRLKPDFGGSGRALYERTIKRVYGREAGTEVLQTLQECPGYAVGIVLNRLKRKDEEWRRLQREWSRTWREVDHKNYFKSIDHQGVQFKALEKKLNTPRAYGADIEGLKTETDEEAAKNVSASSSSPRTAPCSPPPHFEYEITDIPILHDVIKLIYAYLDHAHAQYSVAERRHMARFLRDFMATFMYLPQDTFDDPNNVLDVPNGAGAREHGSGRVSMENHRGLSTGTSRHGSPPRSKSKGKGRATPEVEEELDEQWITEAAAPDEDPAFKRQVPVRPFFSNTTFFALLRIIGTVYSRLLICRQIGEKLAAEKHRDWRPNPLAVELGLDEPNGPWNTLRQILREQKQRMDENVAYPYLLVALERVFSRELDWNTFEEHARWFFGADAYLLFTFDKFFQVAVKCVQSLIGDNRSQEIWCLLEEYRERESVTAADVIRYRREAEQHLGGADDNLYRIDWDRRSNRLSMRLLDAADLSVGADDSALGRWRQYVDSYVLARCPTEWAEIARRGDQKRRPSLFLKRNLPAEEEEDGASPGLSSLSVRVSLGTYKLFFEGEDCLVRRYTEEDYGTLEGRARVRSVERARWALEKGGGIGHVG